MNLILIDDFDSKHKKQIETYFENENTKIVSLDDFEDVDFETGFESVFVLAKIKYNFVSKDMFKFSRNLAKKEIKTQIGVIFLEKFGENAKIVIDWFETLKLDFGVNLSVCGEFDLHNLEEELVCVERAITGQKKAKNTSEQSKVIKDNYVTIYTDGACSGNPGAGGWGAILMHGNKKKEISGFDPETTNNKMELTAVIEALSSLKAPCNVELYSDSAYVVNAINLGWLVNWKSNGWKGSDKSPVKNIELWKMLDNLMQIHKVNFNKVKGHADNEFNNRCDQLATGEIAQHANIE